MDRKGFNCYLGRKKTLSVEMNLTDIVTVIKALELAGMSGMLGSVSCRMCIDDAQALRDRLAQMVDVATGGQLNRKEEM